MMVIGIIGLLLGIVTTAASSSVREARRHKTDSSKVIIEQALATYYAQEGEWPGSIGARIKNGAFNDRESYELTGAEIASMMQALIKKTKEGKPMMDVSGLYVSRSDKDPREETCPRCQAHGVTAKRYLPAGNAFGMDFMEAIRGTKKSRKKMKVAEMNFGYPHPTKGGFMRFRVFYSVPADRMDVTTWHWED